MQVKLDEAENEVRPWVYSMKLELKQSRSSVSWWRRCDTEKSVYSCIKFHKISAIWFFLYFEFQIRQAFLSKTKILMGCLRPFAPKLREVAGTYEGGFNDGDAISWW